MLADYHVHTAYSDDSLYPMEQVVEDAIALGLQEICFTDHVDYGIKRDQDDPRGILYRPGDIGEPEWMPAVNVDYPSYVREIQGLQHHYGGQIRLKLGLEFGVQTHTAALYKDLFARYPFDFILLSMHQIGDRELWNQHFQQGQSQEQYHRRYYEELLAVVEQYANYSTLAHMDLISRYDIQGVFPFAKSKPIVTEILKRVIADGKGIEVNTSSRRYGLSDLTPSREILVLYRRLGGRILTIGSDSHKKVHLGAYIGETMQELKAMGFSEFCTFSQMEPIFHKL